MWWWWWYVLLRIDDRLRRLHGALQVGCIHVADAAEGSQVRAQAAGLEHAVGGERRVAGPCAGG